ncbi:MAG: PHP domain-containing protein [Bacteroidia bacterium]
MKRTNHKNKRHHQIMWAKRTEGYQNLVKLCSYGYTDGYYYKPRIDRNTQRPYRRHYCTTCCLASEVNRLL